MNYLIAFNSEQAQFEPKIIHDVIQNSSLITDWWHYLPNIYIVTTNSNAATLVNMFTKFFPNLRFFITVLDFSDINGILPLSAWDWLNKKKSGQLLFKTIRPLRSSGVSLKLRSDKPKTLQEILDINKRR